MPPYIDNFIIDPANKKWHGYGASMEVLWKIKRAFSLTFAKSNEKSLFLHLICAFSQIILQFAYFSGIIEMYYQ